MSREINYNKDTKMKPAPVLKKLGVVSHHMEMTPFVYKGRLMRVEQEWNYSDPESGNKTTCAYICDAAANTLSAPFAFGTRFTSGYCENDIVYVFTSLDNRIYMHVSDDLVSWKNSLILTLPEKFWIANTSVCKGDGRYVMAFECGRKDNMWGEPEDPDIGHPFTEFFAESKDLRSWATMPFDLAYARNRYCACPALRYCGGYYYMICLEELPLARYAPYIYRTSDFETWEIGLHNPILMFSEEDRHLKPGIRLPAEAEEKLPFYMNINNCDVDLCEFEGKTHVFYLTGNQLTFGVMCEAIYDGTLEQYLKENFE